MLILHQFFGGPFVDPMAMDGDEVCVVDGP